MHKIDSLVSAASPRGDLLNVNAFLQWTLLFRKTGGGERRQWVHIIEEEKTKLHSNSSKFFQRYLVRNLLRMTIKKIIHMRWPCFQIPCLGVRIFRFPAWHPDKLLITVQARDNVGSCQWIIYVIKIVNQINKLIHKLAWAYTRSM